MLIKLGSRLRNQLSPPNPVVRVQKTKLVASAMSKKFAHWKHMARHWVL